MTAGIADTSTRPVTKAAKNGAVSEKHRVIESSRAWFGRNLSNILQFRGELRELCNKRDIDEMSYALGSGFSLLATNLTVTSCVGVFSAGKTKLLSLFLPQSLPSERSPTSRLYTIFEPIEGLETPVFEIAIIGQTEARRFLNLIAKRLPNELYEGARSALECDGDVKAAAEAMYEYLLEQHQTVRTGKLAVVDAAFLCRSLAQFVDSHETVRFERLVDNSDFTAFEQACHYVAWDQLVQFNAKQVPENNLRESLDAWFRGDTLRQIEQNMAGSAERNVAASVRSSRSG